MGSPCIYSLESQISQECIKNKPAPPPSHSSISTKSFSKITPRSETGQCDCQRQEPDGRSRAKALRRNLTSDFLVHEAAKSSGV